MFIGLGAMGHPYTSNYDNHALCISNLDLNSKKGIFGSLLTTFEARNIVEAARVVEKIGLSINCIFFCFVGRLQPSVKNH